VLNINFIPDDYIQSGQFRRTNLIYIILFTVVMAAIVGVFVTIEARKRVLTNQERVVDAEIARKKDDIKKLQELQSKRNTIWNSALTTAELLEPVPRSVLLALLTNDLPDGTSFLKLELVQQIAKNGSKGVNHSKISHYQKVKNARKKSNDVRASTEKRLETHIEIEGIAPSDLQVAAYIEKLGNSRLIAEVALVESKECKLGSVLGDKSDKSGRTLRRFRLTAKVNKDMEVTVKDVKAIGKYNSYILKGSKL